MSGAKKILHVTVVTERQTSKKSFEVDSVIIGRNPDCLLSISHHDVSRRHMSLWVRGEEVWIEDLGSSNGTFINGARLVPHSPQILFPTDKISVGASTGIGLSVQLESVEPVAPPPEEEPDKAEPSEHAETVIFAPPPKKETPKKETPPVVDPPKREPDPEPVFDAPSFPSFESSPAVFHQSVPAPAPVSLKPKPGPAFHSPESVAAPRPKSPSQHIEVNRVLQDAKREAEEIVRMARLEAEHKVQEVYERAESTQKEAEEFYHRRMQEAYRTAEGVYAEAKTEAESLLEKTRKACDEIRRQTNASTAEIRSRTRKECDVLLREAEAQARLMKEQRQQEAEAALLRKEEQLINEIKESMALSQKELQDRIAEESRLHEERLLRERTAHEDQMADEKSTHERRLSQELSAHQEKIDQESKAHQERIRSELEAHESRLASESDGQRKRLDAESDEQQSRLRSEAQEHADRLAHEKERFESETADLRAEHGALTKETASLSAQKADLEEAIRKNEKENEALSSRQKELSEKRKELEQSLDSLEKEKAKTSEDLEKKKRAFEEMNHQYKELLAKKDSASREVESELLQLKTKLEAAKAKMKKEEEEQLVYLKLETAKRVQQTEKELLSEIARKKNAFVKEILVSLEKSSSLISGKVSDWRKETPAIEENLMSLIDGQLFAMKVEGVSAPQKIDLSAQRRRERARHVGFGAVVGMLVLFVGLQTVKFLKGPSPLERAVASEAEARKKDLENRKFNPAKSAAWKEDYRDAVIYTDRFVELTTSDEYQKKWSLAASKHLLKLWKVDEDSSLQVVSIANALVKSLAERKEKIHPDYVKDGLRKMKEAEDEAVKRMSDLLGSQVRFESLKKFEKEFFLAYRDSHPQ